MNEKELEKEAEMILDKYIATNHKGRELIRISKESLARFYQRGREDMRQEAADLCRDEPAAVNGLAFYSKIMALKTPTGEKSEGKS